MEALAGQRIVVMGLGASGRAAAELAVSLGASVVGVDLRVDVEPIEGARLELGPHRRESFLAADLIVVSPGVPAAAPDLVAARAAGIPTVGELAFAWSFLRDPLVIAVTGTNGKSTVTWFTGQLLAEAGIDAFVGGNLGRPLSRSVLEGETPEVYVIEVSSYQMELPGDFAPQIAVILNLTPDHLKRHKTMEGYASAKARVFERMTELDLAILPIGDARLQTAAAGSAATFVHLGGNPGALRDGHAGRVAFFDRDAQLDLSVVNVPGEHNLDNALTAGMLAMAAGALTPDVQRGLAQLRSLAHRMEVVSEQGDVMWINDSKATNVDATLVGVSGLDRTAVVLLGGQAKEGGGFAALAPALKRHRAVITFGGSGGDIADELAGAGLTALRVGSMADAVARARDLATVGDAVLLSPGCASFDAFDNFEHRGRVFRSLVTGSPT